MKQHSGRRYSQPAAQLPFGPGTWLIGAGALIAYGLSRRSKPGTALATAGSVIAFTAAKSKTAAARLPAKATFLVNASAQQAYDLWRRFDNLPRFMAHLKSVQALDGNRSEWVALGPMDTEIRWTAEITEDQPGRRIAWRALPDSQVQNRGFVEFRSDPLNRGTFVTAQMQYTVPGGKAGTAFATFLGKHPEFMVKEDLRRFKALVEAGEAPTTFGQTHGPRGVHGRTEEFLFRETSNHPQPQASALGRSA